MSFKYQNYQFLTGEYKNRRVIFVQFRYNEQLRNELKEKFSTVKWSVSRKSWYLPDNNSIRNELGLSLKTGQGKTVFAQIRPQKKSQ